MPSPGRVQNGAQALPFPIELGGAFEDTRFQFLRVPPNLLIELRILDGHGRLGRKCLQMRGVLRREEIGSQRFPG